jgi:hypothetical protein
VGQAAGGATAISSDINRRPLQHSRRKPLPPSPHASSLRTDWWRQLLSICVGIWRRPAPSHARRRLGAVEVVRDAAAKRRYTPSERGLAQARRRPSTEPAKLTNPTPNRQLRRMTFFLAFLFLPPLRDAKEWRLASTQRRMK